MPGRQPDTRQAAQGWPVVGRNHRTWLSAFAARMLPAGAVQWSGGVENAVGSISSPRAGLCHPRVVGVWVRVGATPGSGERREVQLPCRFGGCVVVGFAKMKGVQKTKLK